MMYYETVGSGKCIVFLHGALQSHEEWKDFINKFSKTAKVIAVDIRGHGKTKEKYSSSYDCAKDLRKILFKEKVKRATFVGHSLGSTIALKFQELYPEMVERMILSSVYLPEISKSDILTRFLIRLRFLISKRNISNTFNDIVRNTNQFISNDLPIIIVQGIDDFFINTKKTYNFFKNKGNVYLLYINDGHYLRKKSVRKRTLMQLLSEFFRKQ